MIPKTITIGGQVLPVVEQPDEFFRETGRISVKRMYLEKVGHTCVGHSHEYDHLTLLAHGVVSVRRGINGNAEQTVYKAPAFIDIVAGDFHQFMALEDETVLYCIHDNHGLAWEDIGTPYVER